MYRIGCPDEPDSLSHYKECPLLYNFFASVWRQATVPPRRVHLFQDLITQVFLRSLHKGIVVMGFIDVIVYAHHQHRRSVDNPGNCWGFHERENLFHDGKHSSLCPRVPVNLPDETYSRGPKSEISSARCQSQISASLQCS